MLIGHVVISEVLSISKLSMVTIKFSLKKNYISFVVFCVVTVHFQLISFQFCILSIISCKEFFIGALIVLKLV